MNQFIVIHDRGTTLYFLCSDGELELHSHWGSLGSGASRHLVAEWRPGIYQGFGYSNGYHYSYLIWPLGQSSFHFVISKISIWCSEMTVMQHQTWNPIGVGFHFFRLFRGIQSHPKSIARAIFGVDHFFWQLRGKVFSGWQGDGCKNLRMFGVIFHNLDKSHEPFLFW